MVLYRDSLLMGLYTLTLAILMLAAPLPLYTVDFTANSSSGLSTSFWEHCPLNASDDGRVIAKQCQIFTVERARCTGEAGLSTLGKLCTVCACCFTGACVILHFLMEHVAMPGYDIAVMGCAVASCFFSHFWWILAVASYSANVCGLDPASSAPGAKIGSNFGIALLAAAFSTAGLGAVFKKDFWADKKL